MISFIYNGIKSQDLGILVNKFSSHDVLAQERIEKKDFQRFNGSVYSNLNSFESYTLDIECTLFNNFTLDVIRKIKDVFKNRTGELILSNKPDHVLKVRLISTINFEKIFSLTGSFILSFEVDPFSLLTSGREWVSLLSGSITNKGNYKSYPMFKVTGSSTCSITINNKVMSFKGVNKPFIIDTELEDIYGVDGENLNNFMTIDSDFLYFDEGVNNISSSGVTSLEILPRWCEI